MEKCIGDAKNIIDRLMASYDDIKAVTDWHMEKGSYWKDFRFEKNRFHFSIGRKTLEDSKAHFVRTGGCRRCLYRNSLSDFARLTPCNRNHRHRAERRDRHPSGR